MGLMKSFRDHWVLGQASKAHPGELTYVPVNEQLRPLTLLK